MWNTEHLQRSGSEFHRIPVGAGAHDDADEGLSACANLLASGIESLVLLPHRSHPSCQRKNAGWEAGATKTLQNTTRYSTADVQRVHDRKTKNRGLKPCATA